ncbi:mtpn [Symbiodinium sp. CCMP2456]|nr:mtpn [Symbiodinium sp. CCMP2456]
MCCRTVSKALAKALKSRYFIPYLLYMHRENILQGDIDFNYSGDNLLERAVTKVPPSDVEEFASLLMNGGADVNLPSRDGYTPLLSACSRGLSTVAEILLRRGARNEAGPRGSTALAEALAFFQACVEQRAIERGEDLDLGRLCCSLRSDGIEMARRRGLPELTLARLRLSEAATEKALLGSAGVALRQEEILAKSGLDKSFAESLGPELWAGWPLAFLTFDLDIKTRGAKVTKDFANARSRILCFKLGQENKKPDPHICSGACFDFDVCDLSSCHPYIDMVDIKTRNRKWDGPICEGRRFRRVPVASGIRGHSYSARMARRMPSAYRGHHVAETLRGGRPKLRKFQLVQEQLRMETCAL